MTSRFSEIRVRELTDRGDWPWRYIVEGLTRPYCRKAWPWSKTKTVPVAAAWVQVPHGRRDYQPCVASDAHALAEHYRARLAAPLDERAGGDEGRKADGVNP